MKLSTSPALPSRVYLIHRRKSLRAEKILQERAFQNPKIEILWDTIVAGVLGETGVEGLEIMNVRSKECRALKVGGVFFYVGLQAQTEFLKGVIPLDAQGYVITDEKMATSVPGLFAAGDVRQKLLRQVSTAVGTGPLLLMPPSGTSNPASGKPVEKGRIGIQDPRFQR